MRFTFSFFNCSFIFQHIVWNVGNVAAEIYEHFEYYDKQCRNSIVMAAAAVWWALEELARPQIQFHCLSRIEQSANVRHRYATMHGSMRFGRLCTFHKQIMNKISIEVRDAMCHFEEMYFGATTQTLPDNKYSSLFTLFIFYQRINGFGFASIWRMFFFSVVFCQKYERTKHTWNGITNCSNIWCVSSSCRRWRRKDLLQLRALP